MKIAIINGPNINFLGIRDKNIYGDITYSEMCEEIGKYCEDLNVNIKFFQSNVEGEIVDMIQNVYEEKLNGIIINPAAYSHYSIAILDALKAVKLPIVEVHISNIYKREEFRQISITAKACIGQISGFGIDGYKMAIKYLENYNGKK